MVSHQQFMSEHLRRAVPAGWVNGEPNKLPLFNEPWLQTYNVVSDAGFSNYGSMITTGSACNIIEGDIIPPLPSVKYCADKYFQPGCKVCAGAVKRCHKDFMPWIAADNSDQCEGGGNPVCPGFSS